MNGLHFVWDEHKDQFNIRKHKIRFDSAIGVFYDPLRIIRYDAVHSESEDRYITIGMIPGRNDILVVVYTMRGPDIVRMISARRATRQEQEVYYDCS